MTQPRLDKKRAERASLPLPYGHPSYESFVPPNGFKVRPERVSTGSPPKAQPPGNAQAHERRTFAIKIGF